MVPAAGSGLPAGGAAHVASAALAAGAALLGVTALLAGCAFSKGVVLKSDPPDAAVRIEGNLAGRTPLATRMRCATFGDHQVALSKDGYRPLSASLEFDWSGRNVTWSALLFWPGLLIVGQCPKPEYAFTLEKETAALLGKATLTIAEIAPPEGAGAVLYVGGQRVAPGRRLVLDPGWQAIEIDVGGGRVYAGSVCLEAGTDYVTALAVRGPASSPDHPAPGDRGSSPAS